MTAALPTDTDTRAAPPTPRLSADTLAAARAVNAHHALRTAAWQAFAFADEPADHAEADGAGSDGADAAA